MSWLDPGAEQADGWAAYEASPELPPPSTTAQPTPTSSPSESSPAGGYADNSKYGGAGDWGSSYGATAGANSGGKYPTTSYPSYEPSASNGSASSYQTRPYSTASNYGKYGSGATSATGGVYGARAPTGASGGYGGAKSSGYDPASFASNSDSEPSSSSHGASGYGASGYGASGYGASSYGASSYGTSGYDSSDYGSNNSNPADKYGPKPSTYGSNSSSSSPASGSESAYGSSSRSMVSAPASVTGPASPYGPNQGGADEATAYTARNSRFGSPATSATSTLPASPATGNQYGGPGAVESNAANGYGANPHYSGASSTPVNASAIQATPAAGESAQTIINEFAQRGQNAMQSASPQAQRSLQEARTSLGDGVSAAYENSARDGLSGAAAAYGGNKYGAAARDVNTMVRGATDTVGGYVEAAREGYNATSARTDQTLNNPNAGGSGGYAMPPGYPQTNSPADYSNIPNAETAPPAGGGSQHAHPQTVPTPPATGPPATGPPATGIPRSSTPWRPGGTSDYPGTSSPQTGFQGARTSLRPARDVSVAFSTDEQLVLAVGDKYQFPRQLR